MDYKSVITLDEIRAYLKGAEIIAFDFETSPTDAYRDEEKAALDAHKSIIAGVSFSVSEGTAIYVPLSHRTGQNIKDKNTTLMCLSDIVFTNPNVIKVAHNLAFEVMFLYAQGIVIQAPCYDTIAAAQLTLKTETQFRGLSDSGLKLLASSLFNAEMPDFQTVTNGIHFDEMNPQDYETIRYACADSDYTLRLYHKFNNWFDRFLPKHKYIAEHVESPTAVFCGLMKYNGLLIDKEAMLQKQTIAEEKLVCLREYIACIIGDVDIGANAGTGAFKKYLFNDLGLPVLKSTAKNQDAADDETMILLTEWCRENKPDLIHLFEYIQEYRKWGKIKSTYIDGYFKHINSATGRIHPNLMPLGTETGRFAARNPNLQNMPRKDNDPVGVRKFIISPENTVLLSFDLSQIELRVGAFYCRDKKMLETYQNGGDIHAQTTTVIFNIPFEKAVDKNSDHYKERRTIAKNCNFGVFFGLFPAGLQKTLKFKAGLNTSLSACESIIESLKNGYPGLTHWQNDIKHLTANRYYAETWLGRRRYITGILSAERGRRSFAERCAMNTPIQGTAADILKLVMGRIIKGIPERVWLKPLLQIHDELVFEVPVNKVSEAAVFIQKCMETQPFPEFDVPITAEGSVGVNFSEMKEIE